MKFRLADIYQFSKRFPGQDSMWDMTAAQRSLIVGGGKKKERRLSLEEMIAMTKQHIEGNPEND